MNLEAINKWLDEEYGCSYTKLEELHDFYFEKYCNLKQENKQLKENWNKLWQYILEKDNRGYEKVYIDDILDEMQEIEGSDSNAKD